jgi:hypothetical protein
MKNMPLLPLAPAHRPVLTEKLGRHGISQEQPDRVLRALTVE